MVVRPAVWITCFASYACIGCGTEEVVSSLEPLVAADIRADGDIQIADDASAPDATSTEDDATENDATVADATTAEDIVDDTTEDDATVADATIAEDVVDDPGAPFTELHEQGLLRYVGTSAPQATSEGRWGAITHTFEDEDGPRCLNGDDFFVTTRDGTSDDLLLFIQAGAVCGSGDCDVTQHAPRPMMEYGILGPFGGDENPPGGFDLAYIPICDGSLLTGDVDHDTDGDGTTDLSFRGLQNLTAALDVTLEHYPSPTRILLVGNSTGGLGAQFALPVIRGLYPNVAIDLVNDSGVGILTPGTIEERLAFWNADAFFPRVCEGCISDEGHLTGYHAYQLEEDPTLRLGYLSSRQDEVVVDALESLSPEAFEAALVNAAATLKAEFGDRFNSMLVAGTDHTFVVRHSTRLVADTSVNEWLGQLLDNGDDWGSVAE